MRGIILATAAALLLLTACGKSEKSKPHGPQLTRITFVTDWKAQAEHGGFYEALAEGLYKKRGLDVKILEGGPSVNVPQLIAGGAADFGIGSNSFIPLNMLRAGVKVKAVMAIFQKDPQVLICHPRPDVKTLAEMKGKPIMISDATIAAFWPWLKAKFGFADAQIRKYTFNLAPFLTDPKAIQEGYLTSEPYTIEKEGHFKPQIFLLADAGYPGYANMVLVPDKWIENNPKAVQAFVDATRQGWHDYLFGNPQPANALIKADNPDMTDDVIAQAIAKMKAYGLVVSGDAKADGIGAMTDARWKTFFDTMAAEGIYPKDLDYRAAYTTAFVRADAGSQNGH
ncbi:MAG: ABC transporter substrate-binding protein [Alphaproteobacteria bacterium]|nr:ABC transporter substrate-binding protein [Alphaproteobacteria bacterium]MDE2013586.1 ABC transporter substrate-binding protein [Alphaproteobacteria bacterium]